MNQFGLLGHLTYSFAINPPPSTHFFIHPLTTHHPLTYLSTHLPVCFSLHPTAPPRIHPYTHLSIPYHLSFTHSSCTHLLVHPCTRWPTHSSVIHLSIHLPTCSANPCKQTKPRFESLTFIHCQRGDYFFVCFF